MDHYVITIARGYGSGGKTIGKMLSEKLDIPYYVMNFKKEFGKYVMDRGRGNLRI